MWLLLQLQDHDPMLIALLGLTSGNVLGKGLIDLLVHVLFMFKLFLPSVMLLAYKGYISIYDE